MPLAWGAKAHAGTGHRDLFFLQAAEGQGVAACLDWYSGFLFSWEVPMSPLNVKSHNLTFSKIRPSSPPLFQGRPTTGRCRADVWEERIGGLPVALSPPSSEALQRAWKPGRRSDVFRRFPMSDLGRVKRNLLTGLRGHLSCDPMSAGHIGLGARDTMPLRVMSSSLLRSAPGK
jgi:hypothetical protein